MACGNAAQSCLAVQSAYMLLLARKEGQELLLSNLLGWCLLLDVDKQGGEDNGWDDKAGDGYQHGGCPGWGHKGVALCCAGNSGDQVGSLSL